MNAALMSKTFDNSNNVQRLKNQILGLEETLLIVMQILNSVLATTDSLECLQNMIQ